MLLTISVVNAKNPAIYVEKVGEGQAILFLPGFTNPGSVWDETIKNLDGKFESHSISYAGFNGNNPIEMPWYSTIKKELITYILDAQLENINIVGHSMGGTLAMDIAAELPDKVNRVLVVDGLPCMREVMMPGVSADQLQYDSPYNNQMLNMSDEAFKQNARMMSKFMTAREDKVNTLVDWILEADRKTYVHGYTDLLKLDLRESLSSIDADLLVLAAPFPDKNTVLATLENQFSNVENKVFVIAEESKHFIMFDQEKWFFEQVNTFLSK